MLLFFVLLFYVSSFFIWKSFFRQNLAEIQFCYNDVQFKVTYIILCLFKCKFYLYYFGYILLYWFLFYCFLLLIVDFIELLYFKILFSILLYCFLFYCFTRLPFSFERVFSCFEFVDLLVVKVFWFVKIFFNLLLKTLLF